MRILRFGLIPLLTLALTVAACGDDDDDAGPTEVPDGSTSYTVDNYPLGAPDDATTTATGLQYIELVVGDGALPTQAPATLVTVHYRGLLPDGTEFDSSYGRGQPTSFTLGGVIAGFGEGVASMHVGGHRVIYIPGNLAYGPGGNPRAGIGPDQPLIFEVELIATE
jgi:FKBP-type peptidyl-prolyl cis-trans isomerase